MSPPQVCWFAQLIVKLDWMPPIILPAPLSCSRAGVSDERYDHPALPHAKHRSQRALAQPKPGAARARCAPLALTAADCAAMLGSFCKHSSNIASCRWAHHHRQHAAGQQGHAGASAEPWHRAGAAAGQRRCLSRAPARLPAPLPMCTISLIYWPVAFLYRLAPCTPLLVATSLHTLLFNFLQCCASGIKTKASTSAWCCSMSAPAAGPPPS